MKSKLIVIVIAALVAVVFGIITSRPDSTFTGSRDVDRALREQAVQGCIDAGGCEKPATVRIVK